MYYLHSTYRRSRVYRVAKWYHISKLETNSLSFFYGSFVLEYAGLSNQRDFFLHGSLVLRICPTNSVEYA